MKLNEQFKNLLMSNGLMTDDGVVAEGQIEKVLQLTSDFLDLRELQHQETNLEFERMKIILDTTPCTVSWIKDDYTFLGVNQTLAKTCEIPAEEFIGKEIGWYTHNKHFLNFTKHLFSSKEKTVYQEIKTELEGACRSFWVVGTKMDDNKKAVIIGIEITELKNLEENVNFMEKLSSLGEMVASIVHEVNNPLMMINAQSSKIKKLIKKQEFDNIEESLNKINSTTEKISSIIRGVKSFVRHGENDPFIEENLAQIFGDARAICEGRIKENGIKMIVDLPEGIKINCNLTQIFQVFVNLITNSIDALENIDEKVIEIKAENINEKLIITFQDSGDGIPLDIQKKIFESFFTTKAFGKGTGLGLSLCKKIMKAHNGDMRIDNDASNTVFVIEFPTQAQESQENIKLTS